MTEPQDPHELPDFARVLCALTGGPQEASFLVTCPHPLLVLSKRGSAHLFFTRKSVWDEMPELLAPMREKVAKKTCAFVVLGCPSRTDEEGAHGLFGTLGEFPHETEVRTIAARAFEWMEATSRAESRGKWLRRYRYELGELVHIARAMSTERDVNKLLGLILEKSRFITGADAGSIYVVEGDGASRRLRFKLTQNESIPIDSREFTIPISKNSIAGSAALSRETINLEDVYVLPKDATFSFDRSFDEKWKYRTKSMLVTPLISQQGEVIGVIQLINKKRIPERRLTTPEAFESEVIAFDSRSEELLKMLSSQAAVSLETATLYEDIQRLFEGFVGASVEAIEARDPTTSGHSRRVAGLTISLAELVDGLSDGPFGEVAFTREDLRELRYASLLHDFGKIGVREKVLVKAKKLYDDDLSLIRARFDYVIRTRERDVLSKKLEALQKGDSSNVLRALDEGWAKERAELEAFFEAILVANEPTVLSEGDFERIVHMASLSYTSLRGDVVPLLSQSEVECLSVRRGSLTSQEFDEIRSHVSHTFRFLSQIPWGKALRRVPSIAGAHHERLNGTGYPNRLRAEEIPLQAKMMSIADIYDALTAADRPYKKSVPVPRALDILQHGVADGHLDSELVRIFTEGRVWERMSISEEGRLARSPQ